MTTKYLIRKEVDNFGEEVDEFETLEEAEEAFKSYTKEKLYDEIKDQLFNGNWWKFEPWKKQGRYRISKIYASFSLEKWNYDEDGNAMFDKNGSPWEDTYIESIDRTGSEWLENYDKKEASNDED